MAEKLRRLLKSHDFLHRALSEYGKVLSTADAQNLRIERDRIFLELVHHRSEDTRVTVAQLKFLLTSMAALGPGSKEYKRLNASCLAHLDRLAAQLNVGDRQPQGTAPPPAKDVPGKSARRVPKLDYRLLDSLTDRAGVYDRNYCFVFSNRANAEFHGRPQSDFVGLSALELLGEKRFMSAKPHLDRCFQGHTVSFRAVQGKLARHYAVRYDPIRDRTGAVTFILATASDITQLVRPDEVNQVPTYD